MTNIWNILDTRTGICVRQEVGIRAACAKTEALNIEHGGSIRAGIFRCDPSRQLSGRVYSDRDQIRAESGHAQ